MSAPTGGWMVTKHPQYVEETTYGTFPTNPTLKWIGPSDSWDPRAEKLPIEIRQLGSEDVAYLLPGQEKYSFNFSYYMQNSDFAKYAVSPQGSGIGSIDKSLSMAMGIRMGGSSGSVYYYKMTGCRPNSITLTGRVNEPISAQMEIFCQKIDTPTTADPAGTGSWASDPGTSPFIFTSGGVNPISVGGSTVPATEISVTINRNLEPLYVIGSGVAQYMPPKHRQVTGSMTLIWNSTNRYTDLQQYTDRDISWTLSITPSVVLTLNGCKFHRLDSFTVRTTELTMEKWTFTGKSASIT